MKRTRLRRRNHARYAREWARAFGSPERADAVKQMECLVPGCRHLSENAHTEGGGAGRRADACTIANICKRHHTTGNDSFHQLGSAELFNAAHNVDVFEAARAIEREHPTKGETYG